MKKSNPTLAVAVTSLAASDKELQQLNKTVDRLRTYFTVLELPDLTIQNMFDSQSVKARIQSLNRALTSADIVLAYNGGYNSVELFEMFETISQKSDSVFIGYSDNTLLANALPASGKARGWLGPMLATMIKNPQYIDVWSANILRWWNKDYKGVSEDFNNLGLAVYQPGVMKGKVIGGNAYTFDLLQGTPYAPSFEEPFIYILEGEDFITDKERVWQDTIRNLDSVLLQPGAKQNIQGLLVGRFPESFTLNEREFINSIKQRTVLKRIPIVYNFPRGYWQPSLTLPLGEQLKIVAQADNTIRISGV